MAAFELPESTALQLTAEAQAEGLTLVAFLQKIAESRSSTSALSPQITVEELDQLLDAEASEDSSYDGTYPRADIYAEHD